MAKRNTSPKNDGKITPAFPSSPTRPPVCALYIDNPKERMNHVHSFAALYPAKKIMDSLLRDREFTWKNEITIVCGDITIKSEQLEAIMEYEFTEAEEAWPLPPPYPNTIRLFRSEPYTRAIDHGSTGIPFDPPTRTTKPTLKEKKPAVSEKKPAVSKDGLITIQQLCNELKLEPSKARQLLRKSKTPKPDAGWAWPPAEADKIRKLLK